MSDTDIPSRLRPNLLMSLVKSKQRVADHGEVFTPAWMVEAMLDLVKGETERIDPRFLESACGDGRNSIPRPGPSPAPTDSFWSRRARTRRTSSSAAPFPVTSWREKRFDFQFVNPPYGYEWSKDYDAVTTRNLHPDLLFAA